MMGRNGCMRGQTLCVRVCAGEDGGRHCVCVHREMRDNVCDGQCGGQSACSCAEARRDTVCVAMSEGQCFFFSSEWRTTKKGTLHVRKQGTCTLSYRGRGEGTPSCLTKGRGSSTTRRVPSCAYGTPARGSSTSAGCEQEGERHRLPSPLPCRRPFPCRRPLPCIPCTTWWGWKCAER